MPNTNNIVHLVFSHLISESVPPEEVMATTSKHACSSGKDASWVWTYFYKPASGSIHCICKLGNDEVNYSLMKSTRALLHHIKKFIYLSGKSTFALSSSSGTVITSSTTSIEPYLKHCPNFEKCLIKWMIAMYQPLHCVEDKHFRAMCLEVNAGTLLAFFFSSFQIC
jgi:hypothetical protein